MINKQAIEKLKSETKIGDKFNVYYHNEMNIPHSIEEIVKYTDKSVWIKSSWMNGSKEVVSRISWNSLLEYIKTSIFRKINF